MRKRREARYVIHWSRANDPEIPLTCSGITARIAFARLLSALKWSGPIIVRRIERQVAP